MPVAAREAQRNVEALVAADRERGVSVSIEATRIGIEGERRVCVSYEDSEEGARALERVRALVAGIDLLNLVDGPCTPPGSDSPKKETPK